MQLVQFDTKIPLKFLSGNFENNAFEKRNASQYYGYYLINDLTGLYPNIIISRQSYSRIMCKSTESISQLET